MMGRAQIVNRIKYRVIHFNLGRVKLKKIHEIFKWKPHFSIIITIESCVKYKILQISCMGPLTGLNSSELFLNDFSEYFRKYLGYWSVSVLYCSIQSWTNSYLLLKIPD